MFPASGCPTPVDSLTPDLRQLITDPDTSVADYVWLPIRFDGAMAYVDWQDEWRVEDHD